MRTARRLSIVAMGALLGLGLVGTAQASTSVSPQTREDTLSAMHGEAFAYASYNAYAQEAARTGIDALAKLFRKTAHTERYDHFAAEARLIHFVRGNADNLRTSIAGETREATVIYPYFAYQAEQDRCEPAAKLFRELAADEAVHAKRFRRALYAITHPHSGVVVPVGEYFRPKPIFASLPACRGRTRENLLATIRGEAFANASYTSYAEKARQTGQPRLARLWENTASQELGEHFAEAAELYGLVRDNKANLLKSMKGELHEATVMYPTYAQRAEQAGDDEAADLFFEIAVDEAHHACDFLLASLEIVVPSTPSDHAGMRS
ncbi:Rubrerythrin [Actinopolymorpha cephalotaxi]|uniref:Rubrerythrin n=1 Tax=Actinopolymorpha cephalotaxi TaxID=504797 RepID=A0A1I2R9I5_9ACTN|nr:rubrerythrin family protein [Actinopolymorpha cephalotaxi]NYH82388.1 rubrerythrin [Actinopolymorpha cephalotaxi]SFG34541.1 Rubrerythrin [Actinopolymorpha cephalotaxi]